MITGTATLRAVLGISKCAAWLAAAAACGLVIGAFTSDDAAPLPDALVCRGLETAFVVQDIAGQIINYELLLNSYYFE